MTTSDQPIPPKTFRGSIRYIYQTMSMRRRLQLAATAVLMFLGGFAELLTIGIALPFLGLLTNPDKIQKLPVAASLLSRFPPLSLHSLFLAATVALVISIISATVIRLALIWVSQKFVLLLAHDMAVRIYDRLLHQGYAYHVRRNTSEVIDGIEKVQTIAFGLLLPGMNAVTSAFIAFLIVLLLVIIDPWTAMIAGGTIGVVYVAISHGTRRILLSKGSMIAAGSAARVKQLQEGLGGIRDILVEHSQPTFIEEFTQIDNRYRRAQAVNFFIGSSPRILVEAVGILLIASLAYYMTGQPGGIMAAIPVLGTLAIGAQRLLPLLQIAFFGWSQAIGNLASLYDVIHLMAQPVAVKSRSSSCPIVIEHPLACSITFEAVCFSYNAAEPILRDISLKIAKGERIGLIGPTGSGKSTLLDILMALLDPDAGHMRIDGVALTEENRANWQLQIAHVPQVIYLADSTIAGNIAFGEPLNSVDLAKVIEAARLAEIHDFINTLPEGYNTAVGERGVRLSGGQRQRLGIARAFYRQHPVLILDEATSALDDATEAAVMANIAGLGRNITVIMIAHRLSTLADCDRVARMQQGRIVQLGTFAEVVGNTAPEVDSNYGNAEHAQR